MKFGPMVDSLYRIMSGATPGRAISERNFEVEARNRTRKMELDSDRLPPNPKGFPKDKDPQEDDHE